MANGNGRRWGIGVALGIVVVVTGAASTRVIDAALESKADTVALRDHCDLPWHQGMDIRVKGLEENIARIREDVEVIRRHMEDE